MCGWTWEFTVDFYGNQRTESIVITSQVFSAHTQSLPHIRIMGRYRTTSRYTRMMFKRGWMWVCLCESESVCVWKRMTDETSKYKYLAEFAYQMDGKLNANRLYFGRRAYHHISISHTHTHGQIIQIARTQTIQTRWKWSISQSRITASLLSTVHPATKL